MISTPLQIAESYIGFRSRALRTNDFGAKTGHNTEIWSGSFLQVVHQEAGWDLPVSLVHTGNLLHFAQLFHLTVETPEEGDLVLYTFPTDLVGMAQPHIGIVSSVENWKSQGLFHAIEGETAPNSSKRVSGIADGVYKRSRWATEVLAFIRLRNLHTPKLRRKAPTVDHTAVHYLKNGPAVPEIQKALKYVFGTRIRGLSKGKWDAGTAHAYAEWQRMCGTEPTGLPGDPDLAYLGVLTGRFVGI